MNSKYIEIIKILITKTIIKIVITKTILKTTITVYQRWEVMLYLFQMNHNLIFTCFLQRIFKQINPTSSLDGLYLLKTTKKGYWKSTLTSMLFLFNSNFNLPSKKYLLKYLTLRKWQLSSGTKSTILLLFIHFY